MGCRLRSSGRASMVSVVSAVALALGALGATADPAAAAAGLPSPGGPPPVGGRPHPVDPHAAPSGWQVVPLAPQAGADESFTAMTAVTDDEAWAVGTSEAGNTTAAGIAMHRVGDRWQRSTMPSVGVPSALYAVDASAPNDVWAVGVKRTGARSNAPLAMHFDGSAWTAVETEVPLGYFSSVKVIGPDDAWAVGDFNASRPVLAHWNGKAWLSLTPPEPPNHDSYRLHLDSVSASGPDDVWAIGYYRRLVSPGIANTYALHWDGKTWTAMLMAAPDGTSIVIKRSSILALAPNDVWAAVNGTNEAGDAYLQHWDGVAWRIVTTLPGSGWPVLNGIAARGCNDIWAVGQQGTDPSVQPATFAPLVVHWDGKAWSSVETPNPTGSTTLAGVSAVAGGQRLWALADGGAFALTRTD